MYCNHRTTSPKTPNQNLALYIKKELYNSKKAGGCSLDYFEVFELSCKRKTPYRTVPRAFPGCTIRDRWIQVEDSLESSDHLPVSVGFFLNLSHVLLSLHFSKFQKPWFSMFLLRNSSIPCHSQQGVFLPTAEPKLVPDVQYCSNNPLLEGRTCFHLFCFFYPLIKSNSKSKGVVRYYQL